MQQPLHHHPFVQLLTVIFSMLACFILLSLAAFFLAIPLFGISLGQLIEYFETGGLQENLMLLKYFQSVQSLGMFVLPPFIIAWLYSRNTSEYLKVNVAPSLSSYFLVIAIIYFSLPFIGFLSQLNQNISFPEAFENIEKWLMNKENSAYELTQKFLAADNLKGLLVNVILVGVLPAVGEEFIFRGVLQKIFARWTRSAHLGILIAAFLFSAMHIQFYGLIPRFFLGLLFGYFMLWSGSIWLPVFGHFVNNTSAVVYYYYTSNVNFQPEKYDSMNFTDTAVLVSVVFVLLLGYSIYFVEKNRLRNN